MTDDFLGLFRNDPGVVFLKPAQELFKKGEPGSHMYVVKSGEVQVVDGNHVFETVAPGGIVGEMSLISDEPRTATVRAVTAAEVVPIFVSCAANSIFCNSGYARNECAPKG